jgi:nicotinamidase-related amidase
MTTLSDRPNTALMVIDVQKGVVGDAHTTDDQSEWGAPTPDKVIAHTNLYWRYQSAPGRAAGVANTQDVTFSG